MASAAAAIKDVFVPIDPEYHYLRKMDHPNAPSWWKRIVSMIHDLSESPMPEDSPPLTEREISISFTAKDEDDVLQVMIACYPNSYHTGGEMILTMDGEMLRFSLAPEVTDVIKATARTQGCELNMVRYLVNGNEYEFVNWIPSEPLQNEQWNPGWKKMEAEFYQENVYPLVITYLDEVLPVKAKILELCAGDGELAEIAFLNLKGKISQYHLIDFNRPSCENAGKRLSEQIKADAAVVHEGDVAKTNFVELVKGDRVDLILGVGALTKGVISDRPTALMVLDEAAKVLKRGGRLILTGLSEQWICADDLLARGFTVENTSCPFQDLQFYVARKN